jgi:nucleotide-binding universal stress UspA family protein
MQPIIVGVDFSNTSLHAIEYAVLVANKMKSDIILVWVDKLTNQESVYPDTSNQNRMEAKKRFEEILEEYSGKLAKGLKIEYKLRKGKVYHEIDNLSKTVGAQLIVAGAHGISGYEEYWIGSNAFRVVSCASCPVLTVRNEFPVGKGIKRILAPIDSSQETLQKFPWIARIAGIFKSEVIVLVTHSSTLKSIQQVAGKYTQQAINYLEKNNIKCVKDELVSNDITRAVINYTVQKKIDLIGIMTEQETPMNILLGPHAQQLVNQSLVPVLSIHPQEQFSL